MKTCMIIMKQKKTHTFNILNVTINTDGHQYGGFEYVKDISMYTHMILLNQQKQLFQLYVNS